MKNKYKIVILGIGGVGGYISAKLTDAYAQSDEIEIRLAARGENERAINEQGLKLITDEGEIVTKPLMIAPDDGNFTADLVVCCTKSYDLETSIMSMKQHIGNETVILPLLNGIDAVEKIKQLLPSSNVLQGCIYLVSRRIAPGTVKQSGKVNAIHFGSSGIKKAALEKIDAVFKGAGLNSNLSDSILDVVWEKYFFISTIATLTSYLDKPIGEIMADTGAKNSLVLLMKELKEIAAANRIPLPEDIIEKSLDKLHQMPYEATSSMHTDFKNGNRTELGSLTGYVKELGKALGKVSVNYEHMYTALLQKS